MSRTTAAQADSQIIAALHPVGRSWRAVIGRFEGDDRLSVIAYREFTSAESSRIDPWLTEQRVGRVLSILPASSVVCRTVPLPLADPAQLEPALRLQAETQFLGSTPDHRMGLAVLDPAPGESGRAGLLLAWPESANAPRPPVGRAVQYVPDIACLAAMMNGQRSDEALIWADREDGSLAVAVSHPQGVVYRATCEREESNEAWHQGVSRVLMETALSVGHSHEFAQDLATRSRTRLNGAASKPATLVLPQELATGVRGRVKGAGDDAWWNMYGVSTGALLATRGRLASFTTLRDEAPVENPSPVERIVNRLTSRQTAAWLVTAAVLVLAFSPLIYAGVRRTLLSMRVGDVEVALQTLREGERQKAMYQALRNEAWSMTKLLADVVAAAPDRVMIESINLDQGKAVSVRGEAQNTDQILEMQRLMTGSNVFEEVVPSWEFRDGTKLVFTITAKVSAPHRRANDLPDYADYPLVERLYNPRREEPTPAPPPVNASTPPANANTGSATTNRPPRQPTQPNATANSSSDGAVLDERGNPARTGPRQAPIRTPSEIVGDSGTREPQLPKVLTAEEVQSMERGDAIKALAAVSQLLQRPSLTDEQRQTYREQHRLLLAKMRETSGGGN